MEKKPRITWEKMPRLLAEYPQLPQEILGDVAVEFAKAVVINSIKAEGEQDPYDIADAAERHVDEFFYLVYSFLDELSSQNQQRDPCVGKTWYTAILDMESRDSIREVPSE